MHAIMMLLGLIALGIYIAALVCWIMVLVKIFKSHIGLGILGLLFGAFAFVYGWIKVKEYKILSVMIIWSVCLFFSLLILPAVLFPAISSAANQAHLSGMASKGREIWAVVVSANAERESKGLSKIWPTTNYASSTDYFKSLMGWTMNGSTPTTYTLGASKICEDLNVSYFSGIGIPLARDSAAFSNTNNAWCVVAQDEKVDVPDETPFLFTRNIDIAAQNGQVKLQLTDAMPLGRRGGVVVNRRGDVLQLKQQELDKYAQTLNPAFLHHVLKP